MIGKPPELEDAELVIGLCERFHCLPSELDREPGEFMKMVAMVARERARTEDMPGMEL